MITMISNPSFTLEGEDWCKLCPNIPDGARRIAAALYPQIKILVHEDFDFPIYSVAEDNLFIITDEDDLKEISNEYGWVREVRGENPLGQFQASFAFLSLCRKQDRWTEHSTTYGLKSQPERLTGIYISDGAFSRAALLAGFMLKRAYSDGSCKINLKCDALHYGLINVLDKVRRQIGAAQTNSAPSEQPAESYLVAAAN